nr:hypothetical protein GCM10020092_013350 [Actinoplanes digitatis]
MPVEAAGVDPVGSVVNAVHLVGLYVSDVTAESVETTAPALSRSRHWSVYWPPFRKRLTARRVERRENEPAEAVLRHLVGDYDRGWIAGHAGRAARGHERRPTAATGVGAATATAVQAAATTATATVRGNERDVRWWAADAALPQRSACPWRRPGAACCLRARAAAPAAAPGLTGVAAAGNAPLAAATGGDDQAGAQPGACRIGAAAGGPHITGATTTGKPVAPRITAVALPTTVESTGPTGSTNRSEILAHSADLDVQRRTLRHGKRGRGDTTPPG